MTWGWNYGTQSRIARHLGVSAATVSRDVKAILPLFKPCPTCSTIVSKERWAELEDWRRCRRFGMDY